MHTTKCDSYSKFGTYELESLACANLRDDEEMRGERGMNEERVAESSEVNGSLYTLIDNIIETVRRDIESEQVRCFSYVSCIF